MGWGPRSFVTQIHSISHGKFSYCFPPIYQAARGLPVFLRLDSDIPHYSDLTNTRLLRYGPDESYYANLFDMSINNMRLNIPLSYFQKGGPDISGCYFTRPLQRKPARGHENLPLVNFHFEGNVDVVVKPETSFHINSEYVHYEYICLVIVPCEGYGMTIIGSKTQANKLFVYDIPAQRLYFGSRDCSQNP
uniref:Xylanase inhibitor C-terminal domain-containing protein n=1 Tax=Kalanchoe fedtschenkoi TaxID=63787 RepID=A0A7N0U760_KALFE